MISVDNITFSYDRKKNIIEDFSYCFDEKHSYVICGANGRGKTTLLRLILGLLQPDKGCINKSKEYQVSYVPDYNGLYENMTVEDNIRFRLGLFGLKYKEEEQSINYYLKKYRVESYMEQMVKQLSLGTKKKIALICALLTKPQVLVMDEPTGGLDNQAKQELINMIDELSEKMMIIAVTHDSEYINVTNSLVVEM